MSLLPTPSEIRARALTDLRMGLPVVVADHIVMAVETLHADRLSAVMGMDAPYLALTDWRARTLNIHIYDTDLCRLPMTSGVDMRWLRSMADPTRDLDVPMKGPFQPLRDGDAGIARTGIALAKAAHLLPAVIVAKAADTSGLTILSDAALRDMVLHPVAAASLPIRVSDAGKLHIFRPDDGGEEHYAIEIGSPDRNAPVLARLHSACFTGDVLGSLKCDCGPQLNAALAQMGSEGAGILLYLNQEGRGIGLANKMRAYALQSQGFDTVEANHRLGFEDDERDFRIGSELLKKLGFTSVNLLTNNPAKVDRLNANGITVNKRIPLHIGENTHNTHYLQTKAKKSGHLL